MASRSLRCGKKLEHQAEIKLSREKFENLHGLHLRSGSNRIICKSYLAKGSNVNIPKQKQLSPVSSSIFIHPLGSGTPTFNKYFAFLITLGVVPPDSVIES